MSIQHMPPGRGGKAAQHRLELLLFRFEGRQLFGINVLKVKEIISCPPLTQIPRSNPVVMGVAELRGRTIPVVDLSLAIGRNALSSVTDDGDKSKVIVAEFNRNTQGFLVRAVDRIIVREWQDVWPPPSGLRGGYVTGVIRLDDCLVQVIDVEKVLDEMIDTDFSSAGQHQLDGWLRRFLDTRQVLVVDDSSIARTHTARTLDELGVPYLMAKDGREALRIIDEHANRGGNITDRIPMVISDIEMPEMDGYQLTEQIRGNADYAGIYVLLHTSLDGVVNADRAAAVGADQTLTKFVPELLVQQVVAGLSRFKTTGA